MKVRNGFVSNSSSSSFVVNIDDLTDSQIRKIQNHIEIAKRMNSVRMDKDGYIDDDYDGLKFGYVDNGNAWDIKINDVPGRLSGWTSMTNFDMYAFMRAIGVDMNKVKITD